VAGDVIYLRGLETRAILGVNEWEREEPQRVVVDLDLGTDVAKAAAKDDLADALNYRTVAKDVLDFAGTTQFFLIETFAERLAKRLMDAHGIRWLRLRVSKPGAIRFSRDVGVEIERGTRDRT
jgi:dihydroneopterin aldolase